MFHIQIIAGLIWGTLTAFGGMQVQGSGMEAVWEFWGCTVGTCAALYIFFLCRMLGAGDVKLMALCTGFLGMEDGIFVIFLGLLCAAVCGAWRLQKYGILWERMGALADFVIRSGCEGKLRAYPKAGEKCSRIRLGPYLWAGYCIYLLAAP